MIKFLKRVLARNSKASAPSYRAPFFREGRDYREWQAAQPARSNPIPQPTPDGLTPHQAQAELDQREALLRRAYGYENW